MLNNKVIFVAYREWAFNIAKTIHSHIHEIYIPKQYFCSSLKYFKDFKGKINDVEDPKNLENIGSNNLILFYGWSWYVPKEIIDNNICICLHPSKLPEYRGGSPIQNQILDGLTESAVTLFKMTEGLDDGPIYDQFKINLNGNLCNIFKEISIKSRAITKSLINDYLNNTLTFKEQDNSKATFCKRRTKKESEITQEELLTKDSVYLYNKIRSLQDPYPNAYIVCADGKKLYLTEASIEK